MSNETDRVERQVSTIVTAVRSRITPEAKVEDVENDVLNHEVVFRLRSGRAFALPYDKFLALYARPN